MNIQLNYLYRDTSNYKNYGWIILSTNDQDLKQIDLKIRGRLFDGEYFNANDVGIPELFFDVRNEDDHEWHEYMSVEKTNEDIALLSLEEFLDGLKQKSLTLL